MTDRELLQSILKQIQEHFMPPEFIIEQGQDLQAELNALPAGAFVYLDGTFVGNFTIPAGMTVRGGTLVGAANGATVIPGSNTTLKEMDITSNVGTSELVCYEQVSNVRMENCHVYGHPTLGAKRGIRLNATNAQILNNVIDEIKWAGAENQGICGWKYAKDITISGNRIEASGINLMFGGADAPSAADIPQNILISNNIFHKKLAWKGSAWTVKNLLELKCAIGVDIIGNTFENVWPAAQGGYALLLKTVHQDGNAPWSEVRDVLVEGNTIINASAAFNLHRDPGANGRWGVPMTQVTIKHNTVDVVSQGTGSTGYFALIYGVDDLTIDHNTIRTFGNTAFYFQGSPCARLVVTNNIFPDNAYGIKGDGTGEGNATLNFYAPGHNVTSNLIITASPWVYPAGNRCEPTMPADTTGYGA
jgi:hypothetical protein